MNIEIEKKQGRRAGVLFNKSIYVIETYSGRGLVGRDPLGSQHILMSDANDEALGSALQDALSKSRVVSMEEYPKFFDSEESARQYENWVARLMEFGKYKTRRSLFKEMICCNVKYVEGVIHISPTRHKKLEAWGRARGDSMEDVVLPSDAGIKDLGGALRIALGRCL
ncbi:contact-dependent growth inhibition system immunity protein [Ralstonia syzygii]|uniref:contact-dependent growth inhibition system immunity protein n=1 Tax=Ralstonia syzygii TaxID=28097 RepID=UPI0018D1699B|nr:contact-dependent growth inhibition system immunity protein [Ralstonia syzygii]